MAKTPKHVRADLRRRAVVRHGARCQWVGATPGGGSPGLLTLPPEMAHLTMPPLLLQPLVENAIKHGLEPQVQGGNITVHASFDGTLITLQVLDTGVGLSADVFEHPAREGGFGLNQVRERLATTYGSAGAIKIESNKPTGTSASVTFPHKP